MKIAFLVTCFIIGIIVYKIYKKKETKRTLKKFELSNDSIFELAEKQFPLGGFGSHRERYTKVLLMPEISDCCGKRVAAIFKNKMIPNPREIGGYEETAFLRICLDCKKITKI